MEKEKKNIRLNFQLDVDLDDFRSSIEFIYGRGDFTDQIMKDFFPADTPIEMNLAFIEERERQFFLGGFISSMVVFQEKQNIAIQKAKDAQDLADALALQDAIADDLSLAMKKRLNDRGITDDQIMNQATSDRRRITKEQQLKNGSKNNYH